MAKRRGSIEFFIAKSFFARLSAECLTDYKRVFVLGMDCCFCEFLVSFRDKSFKADIAIGSAVEEIAKLVKAELAKYDI